MERVSTEEQWTALKAALDAARSGTGRPFTDERTMVEAVVWRLQNGARQRAAPEGRARGARAVVEGGAAAPPPVAFGHLATGVRNPARRRTARTRRCVPRRHRRAGAPEGGGCQSGAGAHGFGRSRDGWETKACTVRDAHGGALGFAFLPGHRSELKTAPALPVLACTLGAVGRVVRRASYSSGTWRGRIRAAGAGPVVRAHPTHRSAPPHDRATYHRHRVENLWARLKE